MDKKNQRNILIESLADRISSLERKVYEGVAPDKKKIGRWKPELNEDCCYIGTDGEVRCTKNFGDAKDKYIINIGNYYKSEQEAEKAKERMILKQEYVDFCEELNDGEEINWRDDEQKKYYI